jgi:hypothetical protein
MIFVFSDCGSSDYAKGKIQTKHHHKINDRKALTKATSRIFNTRWWSNLAHLNRRELEPRDNIALPHRIFVDKDSSYCAISLCLLAP